MLTEERVHELLPLLGKRVSILVSRDADGNATGGDLDCAVDELDRLWPLRADKRWRLCQCLRYDLGGWYWVVENDHEFVAIDTMDDPWGIGSYGFPTSLLSGFGVGPSALAAYLTSKRIRKAGRWGEKYEHERPFADEWQRIRDLALEDEPAFREIVGAIFGIRVGPAIAASAIAGRPPTPPLLRSARIALVARRFRSPARVARGLRSGSIRWLSRLVAPTGFAVAVVGPDGTGKSTLATSLPDACRGPFRVHAHIHWRPGVLPRPGSVLGAAEGDSSRPHARPPHGRALSLALLGYYWLDFLLGAWVRVWPKSVRSGLVVIERGWDDIAVDPRRYRLDVNPSMVRTLGTLLPGPDLVLVLEAPPGVIASRKAELTTDEVARQTREWQRMVTRDNRAVVLDAAQEPEGLVNQAREAIIRRLETRASARLGYGWANLPTRRARWWIPQRTKDGGAVRVTHPPADDTARACRLGSSPTDGRTRVLQCHGTWGGASEVRQRVAGPIPATEGHSRARESESPWALLRSDHLSRRRVRGHVQGRDRRPGETGTGERGIEPRSAGSTPPPTAPRTSRAQ